MLAFVKRRSFVRVIGFLLIALFIWFAGPYFAFADRAPLESPLARLIAIALVVVLWAVVRLIGRLRAGRAGAQLASAVLSQSRPSDRAPSPEAQKLRERFEQAVGALKQQKRGALGLYDLPWYAFIGAPGSGKTTALMNSG
jgi:type VI secretion system protein ImpL